MISDEPDEDADDLDDENMLETYVSAEAPTRRSDAEDPADVREWPRLSMAPSAGPDTGARTLTRFRVNHADWQQQLGMVLQGAAGPQTPLSPDSQPRD
jgi:hypothetical protein